MDSEGNLSGQLNDDQADRGMADRSENNYYDEPGDQYQSETHEDGRRHDRDRSRSRERGDGEQERGWGFEENSGHQVHGQEETNRSGGGSTSLYITNLAFQV